VLQQLGLALRTVAHIREAELTVHPHRQHVISTDENADLAHVKVVFLHFDRLQHGEQGIAIFIDLRALMAFARIFDGELVQTELFAHFFELLGRGIFDRDPDEAVRPLQILADVFLGDVCELAAFQICHTVDQHERPRT
jgi:hypothetical protein